MRGKGVPIRSLGWIAIAGIGAIGGWVLGQFTVGENPAPADGSSYAQLSGNPDALGVEAAATEPCFGCADGYVAPPPARIRAARMDDAFRDLGTVTVDDPSMPDQDYEYGGRFDEPAAARDLKLRIPVPVTVTNDADTGAARPTPVPALPPPPAIEGAEAENQPLD